VPQSDFVTDFMTYTEGALSPELFRLWTGIALVAGACERRIWLRTGRNTTFPNLYTLLVAPPGVGKQVIDDARELWTDTREANSMSPAFKVAPDSVTKASLIDSLAKAKTTRLPPSGPPIDYHSLLVAAEEFSVLLPQYDLEFIGVLNKIYNNPNVPYSEARRTGSVREVSIDFPQLNILGGAQPGWLKSVFPEEAWSTGLTSRIIMVYCSDVPLLDIFAAESDNSHLRGELLSQLSAISSRFGELSWEPAAQARISEWHLAGGPPTPEHSKLVHYVRRRTLHALKLTLISAVSRGERKQIAKLDVDRAIAWLLDAERLMPDIFRAMIGKSDVQVMEDLHYFILTRWKMQSHKPIREAEIYTWLSSRVPSDKVNKIIEVAERSGIMERFAGTTDYKPLPKRTYGVE